MKTLFLSALFTVGSLVLPGLSYAATFQYVDVTGSIQDVVATDAMTALVIPDDIAENSGVIQVTEQTEIPEFVEVSL